MRMMLRVTVPVEQGNKAVKDGSMAETIGSTLDDLKPEAAYFLPDNWGKRTLEDRIGERGEETLTSTHFPVLTDAPKFAHVG